MSFKKYDMKKRRYQEKSSDTKKKKDAKQDESKKKRNCFSTSQIYLFLMLSVLLKHSFFFQEKPSCFQIPLWTFFFFGKIFFFFFENMFEVFFSNPFFTNHPLFFS